jgi:hypothetical protein
LIEDEVSARAWHYRPEKQGFRQFDPPSISLLQCNEIARSRRANNQSARSAIFRVSLRFRLHRARMYIVAIAWIYVVLMMSVTETSVVAGVMTFMLYGALPVGVLYYLAGTGRRKRRRQAQRQIADTDSGERD